MDPIRFILEELHWGTISYQHLISSARNCGVSVGHLRTALYELAERGLIEKQVRKHSYTKQRQEYVEEALQIGIPAITKYQHTNYLLTPAGRKLAAQFLKRA